MNNLPTPAEICDHLEEYVIGQDDAKRVLSVAVYNHYKRVAYASTSSQNDVEIKKSNIMMIGPTGSGKTYLVTTLARFLGVPSSISDATSLISAGNASKNIEGVLASLIQNANYDIKRAEQGIIYIDEIDKLAKKYGPTGEAVQQALLKIIEGSTANVTIQGKIIQMNTDNILIIAGGAFVGLASLVRMRIGDVSAGLLTESELIKKALPSDLARFGMIPEFCGRLPIIACLNALDIKDLYRTLVEPKNALVDQYKKMFALDGIDLVFEQRSIEKIAEKAIGLNTGARGLRTVMEDSMRDIMFVAPSEKNLCRVIVTPEVIMKTGHPILEYIESVEETEIIPLPIKTARNTSAYMD